MHSERAESGEQLHTHFLAPSFSKDQVLSQKNVFITKMHAQILEVFVDPAEYQLDQSKMKLFLFVVFWATQ